MQSSTESAVLSRSPSIWLIAGLALLSACVTVNVYFPAAAAENAADRFIRGVYGEPAAPESSSDEASPEPQSGLHDTFGQRALTGLLDFVVPAAHAQQPDITISTPGINKLQSAMNARHEKLKPYYESGAVGMDSNGFITLRDESAIPLKDRNNVKKLVADENNDREALYREVASANGHPEWKSDIQAIFAKRWVANAPSGWWYQSAGGDWVQK
ncbi:uncharacterized protein YdbL (DUF1318 family) [Methylohalomonas lacus]|uniref:Uncharacterized protein YdbL (DUF1318 family) n=1 Tax=Methylohalomonas lacus TaxID=398773 RepID=A0AAE3HMK4_9GAMM|nr:YdbL family protein [Methylohalomonas lacus]MCS3903914.1 uncharacterized protein YdbL (DUF1318 family) [Methylohalomonas lacus]